MIMERETKYEHYYDPEQEERNQDARNDYKLKLCDKIKDFVVQDMKKNGFDPDEFSEFDNFIECGISASIHDYL
jgi:hypothetical protein